MSVSVEGLTREQTLAAVNCLSLSQWEYAVMRRCLRASEKVWVGYIDDQLVCIYGIIMPSLLSQSVHLWLHVTSAIEGHEFVFVRHSQRVVQELLKEYPLVHGVVGSKQAAKWLKWLGATIEDGEFQIVSKANG